MKASMHIVILGLLLGTFSLHAAPMLVIAHRGDSGNYPEHTWLGYQAAAKAGADFIELDVVSDRDGELWVRHESELTGTTNAGDLYPNKYTQKTIGGEKLKGVFSEDLSTVEMRKVVARQRFSFRSKKFNDRESLLTIQDLVARVLNDSNKNYGVYIETKDPEYFRERSLPLEEKLVHAVQPLIDAGRPVIFQSQSLASLARLKALLPNIPRTLLVTENDTLDWASYKGIVDILGLQKQLIIPFHKYLRIAYAPTQVVNEAHRRGYQVHAWTFRREWWFRPVSLAGPEEEYLEMRALGVDGVFSDNPELALKALGR